MNEELRCGELQQLVQEEEGEESLSRGGEATPPSTPARSKRTTKTNNYTPHTSQVLWESNNTQTSPIISKTSSGQATTSQGSMISGKTFNLSSSHGINQSRLVYVNEKDKQRINKSDHSRINKHREVPDVRRMEQALLQLLEDFHSGNLRAFGKDCSMEQMTEIREQQERLARLHFELGQRQDGVDGDGVGLGQSNMRHLLHRLQQLSLCIEKLHNK
ncbi:uncharacterized protein [Chelonus insularis]|uniref:uncharacterized protein isoform X2 n=1 Tax=Chelonus insularis TaxID=460826 RepID=UPI0015887C8E|nr:uncharacterized protein LOC118074561 isoform X2 [Chelonus insularis]